MAHGTAVGRATVPDPEGAAQLAEDMRREAIALAAEEEAGRDSRCRTPGYLPPPRGRDPQLPWWLQGESD